VFEFIGEPQLLEVHVYSTQEFGGTVVETEGVSDLIFTDICVITSTGGLVTVSSHFAVTNFVVSHFVVSYFVGVGLGVRIMVKLRVGVRIRV